MPPASHLITTIGGGPAARRYCEALAFDPEFEVSLVGRKEGAAQALAFQFGIPFQTLEEYFETPAARPETIVLATPPGTKLDLLQSVLRSRNPSAILLEKPFSLHMERAISMLSLLNDHGTPWRVAFSRDFSEFNYHGEFVNSPLVEVTWPYFQGSPDPLIHQLPHIIHWALRVAKNSHVTNAQLATHHDTHRVELATETKYFEIQLEPTQDSSQNVCVNGVQMPWPRYHETHAAMLQHLVHAKQSPSRDYQSAILETVRIMNTLIGDAPCPY